MSRLFESVRLGQLELRNRVVMAPMTRSRAGRNDEPTDLVVEYYRQRASAGMIVSEGIYPSFAGKGYCRTPGLVTPAHVEGWRRVCEAVHAEGGTIVAQLMHCGRVCHADNKPADAETLAPSAIAARGEMYTDTSGMQPFSPPRALRGDEIAGVVEEYRCATQKAFDSGFDGVELHGSSGYLPAQFLSTGTNRRDDAYGGSLENRIRFPVEVLEAMTSVAGADRVGLRICPGNPFNDLSDDDPEETFTALLRAANPLGLAYLHVIRLHDAVLDNIALARRHFDGPLILNDGYKLDEAKRAMDEGAGEAIAFARAYIGNPDLVERFRRGAPLARFDPKKLYTQGPDGYTDFPPLSEAD
ncbi:MAG: alkene reductase [Deltaproteobacteria bacterium]|nr:alkene reductase [Deltaproteobacteria bacterium]MBW2362482.1 alkene reductase [Deltaproteobacteria bacterium]